MNAEMWVQSEREARECARRGLIAYVNQRVLVPYPGYKAFPFHILDVAHAVWSILQLRDFGLHPSPTWGWPESPFVAAKIVEYAETMRENTFLYDGEIRRYLVPHPRHPEGKDKPHREWLCDGKRFIYEFHGNKWEQGRTETGFGFIPHQG